MCIGDPEQVLIWMLAWMIFWFDLKECLGKYASGKSLKKKELVSAESQNAWSAASLSKENNWKISFWLDNKHLRQHISRTTFTLTSKGCCRRLNIRLFITLVAGNTESPETLTCTCLLSHTALARSEDKNMFANTTFFRSRAQSFPDASYKDDVSKL